MEIQPRWWQGTQFQGTGSLSWLGWGNTRAQLYLPGTKQVPTQGEHLILPVGLGGRTMVTRVCGTEEMLGPVDALKMVLLSCDSVQLLFSLPLMLWSTLALSLGADHSKTTPVATGQVYSHFCHEHRFTVCNYRPACVLVWGCDQPLGHGCVSFQPSEPLSPKMYRQASLCRPGADRRGEAALRFQRQHRHAGAQPGEAGTGL